MFKTRLKNFVRLLVGLYTAIIPNKSEGKFKIYFNLMGGKVYGGPNRFLTSITSSSEVKNKISISNWSLKGCKSALVFSSSWGRSFSYLAKLLGVHTVLRVDGFYVPEDKIDEEFQQSRQFRNWLNGRLATDLEAFDHIIYQSEFSKRICDQYLFKRNKDFTIISNGTNIGKFEPKYDNDNKVLRLAVLGKHYPKHLNLALDILKLLDSKTQVELNIIGPMRNGVDGVSLYYDELNLPSELREKIKCHGIVSYDDLPETLNSCDILLHVKVGDWCPNAVLEAMASGLPVVCPSWGGTTELVGEAGVSVDGPEWDFDEKLTKEMAEAVLKVQSDLVNYKKIARKRVEEHFDIEDVSKKYLKVLKFYS